VRISDRKIVGEILHNFGTKRHSNLTVTSPLVAEVGAALTVATEVVTRNERGLKDPDPQVGIAQISDGGIKIGVHPWVCVIDVDAAAGELYRSLTEHFQGRGPRLELAPVDIRLVDGAPALAAR
jgi:small conductance mechanosensitive channel